MRICSALSVASALLPLFFLPSVARASKAKACDLLSAQDATSVAGVPVAEPSEGKKNSEICKYVSQSDGPGVSLVLTDARKKTETDDFLQFGISATRSIKKEQGESAEQIPDLGDLNLLLVLRNNNNNFFVLYHHKIVVLFVFREAMTSSLKTAMIQTMRQILAKL